MAVGRISGPLLKANLIRNGVDLAFETDLLYLDVNNDRIGIKKSNPSYELDINGTAQATNLIATNSATTGNLTFQGNTISSTLGTIELTPSGGDPVIYHSRIQVDSIEMNDNTIKTIDSNASLELNPQGTGTIELIGNTNVTGNLYATGNITAGGNIQLGDTNTDTVEFNADIVSDIIPDVDNAFTLGTEGKRWRTLNSRQANIGDIQVTHNTIETINSNEDLTIRANGTGKVRITNLQLNDPGNTLYVAANGSDSEEGNSIDSAFATVSHALSQASSGTIIKVLAGTYTETFPLTVPAGVTVSGEGLRATIIKPSVATQDLDGFRLNNATTIQDLTIKDMKYNVNNDTGYAFSFDPTGVTTTLQSPYIKNVTVLNKGTVTSASDPYGFDSADAGRGAKIDGQYVTASSIEAAMLFNEVTIFSPNQTAMVLTNGVRVEWLNSFIYFADKGISATTGTQGRGGDGKTLIDLTNTSGTFNVTDTVTLTSEDGSTVLGQGTIEAKETVAGNLRLTFDGKVTGFVTNPSRTEKTTNLTGNTKQVTSQYKFGTASLQVDGTGDTAVIPSTSDFGFGTRNFTVEGFFRFDTVSGTQYLVDLRSASASDTAVSIYADGTTLKAQAAGSDIITSASTLLTNTWYHIALVRSDDGTELFLNGIQQGATYSDSNDYGTAKPVTLGGDYNNANHFTGYIDEVRISSLPRYLANFTTPSAEFTGDQSTLYLSHFNGANNSTTINEDTTVTLNVTSSSGGTATGINNVDLKQFGAEMRSISSANVYGNQGVVADGEGVVLRMVNHNFGYIGVGKRLDNDVTAVIQGNEVTELNNGKVYYSSVDQGGDFRVGDAFTVDQQTGNVTFTASSFDISSLSGITFSDGGNTTIVEPSRLETGNIRISGNQIITTSGDLTINPDASSSVIIDGNLDVTGGLREIRDQDGDTTITTESAYGADEDTINFKVANNILAFIDSTGFNTTSFISDEVKLINNGVQTFRNDNNLELFAHGTGHVDFNDTNAFRIPRGTTAERPGTALDGMMRYNTTSNVFELYSGGFWNAVGGSVSGVVDQDLDTYITAENTPGADDDTFRFYNAGAVTVDINSTRLNAGKIHATEIGTEGANIDLVLAPNGVGKVKIDDTTIRSNEIKQTATDGVLNMSATGEGYVDFTGTVGFKVPVGDVNNRPISNLAQGLLRYNTDDNALEIWSGSAWTGVVGSSGGVTINQAEELSIINALLFG